MKARVTRGRYGSARALLTAHRQRTVRAGVGMDVRLFTLLAVSAVALAAAAPASAARPLALGFLDDVQTGAPQTASPWLQRAVDSSASIVRVVAERLEAWDLQRLVVDPVMAAKSGDFLLQQDAVNSVVEYLLPLAMVVTPNIPEAQILSKIEIVSDESARDAARAIASYGPRFVVIKGGHAEGSPDELVFDGRDFTVLEGRWVITLNTHGTGCTFSAAIAARLAIGDQPLDAIRFAKDYVTRALESSYSVGRGHSPVNHFPPAERASIVS